MALITCCKCGNQISDKSENCIHCGTSTILIKTKIRFFIIFSLLVLILHWLTGVYITSLILFLSWFTTFRKKLDLKHFIIILLTYSIAFILENVFYFNSIDIDTLYNYGFGICYILMRLVFSITYLIEIFISYIFMFKKRKNNI